MNIRKEYPKVCLFLWILGMCFHAHPILAQSVIPVPLKMEQGTGSFLLSEKTKLYTNLQGGEAELWENYLKALPVQLKEARMKDRKQIYFAIRMAATKILHEEECPVILDDVFGYYDDSRLAQTLRWLKDSKRQVIIFSCQKREMEMLEKMGCEYHKVML